MLSLLGTIPAKESIMLFIGIILILQLPRITALCIIRINQLISEVSLPEALVWEDVGNLFLQRSRKNGFIFLMKIH
jgi:hypothetical protein